MRRKREEEEEYEEDEDGKEAKTRESRSTDRAKRREFKFPDRPTFTPNLASEEIPDASNTGTFNVANGSDPQSHSNESASSSPVPRSPSMSISSLLGDFDDEERERQTERARERTSSPKDTAQREVAVVKIKSPPTPSTSTPSTIHLSFSPPVSAFPDLPTLPLTPTPLSILSFFLTEINPVLGYLFHPPTLTTPPPLLLAAIFGYTVPHMPFATTKERHTLSLGYFHRAQQLLQPLVPQLGSRKASLDEIVAVLLMGLLAGTSGESAGLGYRLGFFAATLARRGFGNVVEDRKEEMELARVAPEVALESERRRRIFWLLVRSDRFSAAAVADSSYELPVLPDDKVRGFLLPSEDEDYAVSVDPMVFLERGWKGEDVINGEAMGAGEVYWTARLFILLGWCVDFHKVSWAGYYDQEHANANVFYLNLRGPLTVLRSEADRPVYLAPCNTSSASRNSTPRLNPPYRSLAIPHFPKHRPDNLDANNVPHCAPCPPFSSSWSDHGSVTVAIQNQLAWLSELCNRDRECRSCCGVVARVAGGVGAVCVAHGVYPNVCRGVLRGCGC
jgi:hypothetical protein